MPIDASKYGIPVQKSTGTTGTIDVLKYGTPVTPTQVKIPQKTVSEKIANTTDTLFGGKQIGEAIGTLSARASTRAGTDIKTADYSKLTPEMKAKLTAQGVPITREAQLEETAQGIKGPTAGQLVGDVARIGLNFVPVGKLSQVSKLATPLSTAAKLKEATKVGAIFGAGTGGVDALREGGNAGDILKGATIGGVAGGVFGGALGLAGIGLSKVGKNLKVENAVNNLESKYTEWSTGTKPGKKLVQGLERKTDALNQAGTVGKTPMRGLAEKGIVPEIQGTKFNTFEQAQNYRSTVSPLRETNREALQEIAYSTPKLKLSELEQKAIAYARTPQNINSGRFDSMYNDIRKEFGLLKEHYPSGELPITVVDDIKSARWDNVFKNKSLIEADVLRKDSEYAIAKSLQKSIEDAAIKGGHTEVAQLNREIGDILEEAKFLESLDGKVLKGGRVGKYVGTLVGASLGQTIPGKIIGAVGGNVAADLLIKSSVQSPIRRIILSKLKLNNPEAYTATVKWLAKQDAMRATQLKLPSPAPLGTSENPIITPAPTTFEAPAHKINRQQPTPFLSLPKAGETSARIPLSPSGTTKTNYEKDLGLNEVKNASINRNTKIPLSQGLSRYKAGGSIQSKSPNNQQTNPAITSVASNAISKTIQQIKKIGNKEGGFIAQSVPFKNEGNLTTKILKDLEGKTTVSKQYILDATNRGELKQVERDITRQVLDTMPDGQIDVKEFADKVKSELLPLKVRGSDAVNTKYDQYSSKYMIDEGDFSTKYDHIALPDEVRGKVANYKENIYESPIATSAGNVHFGYTSKNYFGHTRIEDMADNKTRRIIEVQSDLYQKGNLENDINKLVNRMTDAERKTYDKLESFRSNGEGTLKQRDDAWAKMEKIRDEAGKRPANSKLQQYNDPTAHFRMVREEIKKASQDGKTKLQFPTGETAMKIEGLGDNVQFYDVSRMNETRANGMASDLGRQNEVLQYATLKPTELKVGQEVSQGAGNQWIITDVLGDGKFKAIPKQKWDDMDAGVFLYSGEEKRLNELWGKNQSTLTQAEKIERDALFKKADQLKESFQFNREIPDTEQFDISGKVDTNNPIYKFYEKDVQKYLNKFGGKRVVDDKGVSWIEIPITKEQGKTPVEAFGKIRINPLIGIGVTSAIATYGAGKLSKKK